MTEVARAERKIIEERMMNRIRDAVCVCMRRVEKRVEERKIRRKKKNKEWAGTLYAEGPRSQGPRSKVFSRFFGFLIFGFLVFLQGNPPNWHWHTRWREISLA